MILGVLKLNSLAFSENFDKCNLRTVSSNYIVGHILCTKFYLFFNVTSTTSAICPGNSTRRLQNPHSACNLFAKVFGNRAPPSYRKPYTEITF